MRSRRSAWGVALALALVVLACQPADDGEQAGAVEPDEEVTLRLWHSGTPPPLERGMEALVEQFEEDNPNITVQMEVFPFEEYFSRIATATAAGEAPDVFWVDVTHIAEYAYYDTVLELDDYISDEDLDDYLEAPRADMEYEGAIRSLPMHQSTEALVYVEDVLEEHGIEAPQSYDEAWTWDEFVEILEEVVERDGDTVTTWGYSLQYGPGLYSVQPFLHANGGAMASEDSSQYVGYLDSEESIEAVEWWTGLYSERRVAPVDVAPDMLETGRVVFFQTNPFTLKDIQERQPDMNLGVAPVPCNAACAVNSGGWHIGIHEQTENPDAAWELVYAIAGPEGHREWVELTGYMPARQSAYEAVGWVDEYPWNVYWEGLHEHAIRRPQTPVFQYLQEEFNRVLNDGVLGADVRSALEELAPEVEERHQRLAE